MPICGVSEGKAITCSEVVKEYKADMALVSGLIVCLVLGILATVGVLNGMGLPQAAYFSYGMYAGAALFLAATIIKVLIHCREGKVLINSPEQKIVTDKDTNATASDNFKPNSENTDGDKYVGILAEALAEEKRANERVTAFEIEDRCSGGTNCKHQCEITFAEGIKVTKTLNKKDVYILWEVISSKKIKLKNPREDGIQHDFLIKRHFTSKEPSSRTANQILDEIRGTD